MKKTYESETAFLSTYNIEDYDRPSVATDIVAFSIYNRETECYRRNPEQKLLVLLIKRGEHPYMGSWALPGGFLRKDETIEECAYREIKEETNVEPVSLMPVGVFSEPDRDLRGRIISNAFTSIISEEGIEIMGGDDADDAKWFEVSFDVRDDGECVLKLKNDSMELSSLLKEEKNKFGKTKYEIIDNTGLAFDHAKIIATALSVLKKEAENLEVMFDFLPEKFTLSSLQNVQETLMGITLLTANFRRKIADYVEETDEYTDGVGHRPARLFRRKKR